MTMSNAPTGPPVQPPPPRPSPPPLREPGSHHLPTPTPGTTASATHGKGFEITGHGTKPKTTYRVGSTTPGHTTAEFDSLDQVLALIKQMLAGQEQAAAANPGSPPPPATVTISQLHTLPPYREGSSGTPAGSPRRAY